MYGSFGVDFIEMHHEEPLSLSRGPTPRRLTDLVPVYSNCHRILHRRRDEVMTTDQLRHQLEKSRRRPHG